MLVPSISISLLLLSIMPRRGQQAIPLTSAQCAAIDLIKNELERIVTAIPRNSRIIGPLNGLLIRAPLTATDGRVLTWSKLLNSTIKVRIEKTAVKFGLVPELDGCWFIEKTSVNDSNNYVGVNFSKSGSSHKLGIHRVLYQALHPDVNVSDSSGGMVAAHRSVVNVQDFELTKYRCRNGMCTTRTPYNCVNPHHIVWVSQAVNVSHAGCANATTELCIHTPKCLFISRETGLVRRGI